MAKSQPITSKHMLLLWRVIWGIRRWNQLARSNEPRRTASSCWTSFRPQSTGFCTGRISLAAVSHWGCCLSRFATKEIRTIQPSVRPPRSERCSMAIIRSRLLVLLFVAGSVEFFWINSMKITLVIIAFICSCELKCIFDRCPRLKRRLRIAAKREKWRGAGFACPKPDMKSKASSDNLFNFHTLVQRIRSWI